MISGGHLVKYFLQILATWYGTETSLHFLSKLKNIIHNVREKLHKGCEIWILFPNLKAFRSVRITQMSEKVILIPPQEEGVPSPTIMLGVHTILVESSLVIERILNVIKEKVHNFPVFQDLSEWEKRRDSLYWYFLSWINLLCHASRRRERPPRGSLLFCVSMGWFDTGLWWLRRGEGRWKWINPGAS